jgi:hypothetical protein
MVGSSIHFLEFEVDFVSSSSRFVALGIAAIGADHRFSTGSALIQH